MVLWIIFSCIIVFLSLYYLTGRNNEEYWKKRGVVFYKKNKIAGPVWDFMTKGRSLSELFDDIYKQHKNEPAIGIGAFLTPTLYVIHPTNIQHVLQGDFASFSHSGTDFYYEKDLLANSVPFANGNRWKLMRQSVSPLFTSTKLKNMYYILDKSAKDFVQLLKDNPQKLENDVYGSLSSYCSSAIAASVFGITTESVFDSPYHAMGQDVFKGTFLKNLKFGVSNIFPSAIRKLGICFFKEHENLFIGTIKQILRQREKEGVKKYDFPDTCLSIQKNGTLKDRDTGFELEPTDEMLAAQGFFFFVAGVEPTAVTMFAVLLELGLNPEILQRVHKEIDDTHDKYESKFTYDIIMEMEYLNKVLSEALRKHPPIGFLNRQCVRDSILPVGNIKVSKGTRIVTPVVEMHRDPKIYENPEKFDPERFADGNKNSEITYQPFGKGGRICIGMRFARVQALAGLVYLLRNYTVHSEIGKGGVKYNNASLISRPLNVEVKLSPRK